MKNQIGFKNEFSAVRLLVLLTACLLFVEGDRAQKSDNELGRVEGHLLDFCKIPISNALITAEAEKFKKKTKSKKDGSFLLKLPPNSYTVTVNVYGFKKYIVNNVFVISRKITPVNLKMESGYASDDPDTYKHQKKREKLCSSKPTR